ncbi:MAG: flotillin [Alphaproteobacteria bacterium]|nr:flotillin [Alphaproteobacteria bacterium]
MAWFVGLIILIVVAILAIIFLNKFYRKSTREVALVRTGAGGQRVILDGGCLALPFLHKVSEVNMRTTRLEMERLGPKSIITKDRLRVDAAVEFYVRVQPTAGGVATAAQALAGKSFRASELAETLEGKLVDAMLSVAARYTMDSLQDERAKYVAEVSEALHENLGQNGLVLESVSLTRLDQTPFHALDENNAFNALGMRRLAEIIAVNKKERAEIESDADVSVRRSHLEATKRKLLIEQEEEQAMIEQQREIETSRAISQADVAEQQADAELRREHARINREQDVRSSEIERDRAVRALEVESSLRTETAQIDKAIQLAAKNIEEAKAKTKTQGALAEEVAAQETVETERQKAVADREKELALIRAREQAEVDETRVESETETIRAMASAEAEAIVERAKAQKNQLIAKAEGEAALIKAENAQSDELIAMKLDMAKLDTLPDLVGKMLKPAEKIESIRINHITGFGPGGGGGGSTGEAGDKAVVNQVVDGVLNMALQMPAVKKLGEEVGMNIADGVSGLSDSLTSKSSETNEDTPQKTSSKDDKTDA